MKQQSNNDEIDSTYTGFVVHVTNKVDVDRALRDMQRHHPNISFGYRAGDDCAGSGGDTVGLGRKILSMMCELDVDQAAVFVCRTPHSNPFVRKNHPSQRIGLGLRAARAALLSAAEESYPAEMARLATREKKETNVAAEGVPRFVRPKEIAYEKTAPRETSTRTKAPRRRWMRISESGPRRVDAGRSNA